MPAFRRAERSLAFAYILWSLFGPFGAHRFYLGHIAQANARFLFAALAASRMALLKGGDQNVPQGKQHWILQCDRVL